MNEDQNSMNEPSKPKGKQQEEAKVTLSMTELRAMIAEAVTAADTQRADQTTKVLADLAEAIKDSRKPYKDPLAEANDQMMRDQMRQVNKRIAENIKASQISCQHFQGSNELSDFQGALTSIVKHVTDTGVVWGICTNCLRQFWPTDPDYRVQMQRKSGNRPSAAGRRWFADPQAAAQAGMPQHEDRDEPVPVAV